jgi:hypothetical protein
MKFWRTDSIEIAVNLPVPTAYYPIKTTCAPLLATGTIPTTGTTN